MIKIILELIKYLRDKQMKKAEFLRGSIDCVVQNYFTIRKQNNYDPNNFADFLIKAGILTIKKTRNKKEVIKRILLHGEQDNLNILRMDDKSVERFFKELLSKIEN